MMTKERWEMENKQAQEEAKARLMERVQTELEQRRAGLKEAEELEYIYRENVYVACRKCGTEHDEDAIREVEYRLKKYREQQTRVKACREWVGYIEHMFDGEFV